MTTKPNQKDSQDHQVQPERQKGLSKYTRRADRTTKRNQKGRQDHKT